MGAAADAGADGVRRPERRQFRSAARRPGGRRRHRPPDHAKARPHAERDRQHALRRLRPAAGVDDLQRAQPVSRRDGGRAALLAASRDDARRLCLDLGRQSVGHAIDQHQLGELLDARPPQRPARRPRRSPPIRRAISPPIRWPRAATPPLPPARRSRPSKETMVPLSAVAVFHTGHTPLGVNHQGQFAAATISFNLAPGKAISDAQSRDRRQAVQRHRHAVHRARRLRRHGARLAAGAVRADCC